MVCRPAAAAARGDLEMQILGPNLTPTGSETRNSGVSLSSMRLLSPPMIPTQDQVRASLLWESPEVYHRGMMRSELFFQQVIGGGKRKGDGERVLVGILIILVREL